MSIDPKYLVSPNFQNYLVDKDTGLPLSGGKIYLYEDNNRSVPKPAYQISGSPPNYTFVPLPNPIILSAVGTVQDNSGNDIVPYFLPIDSEGNLQFYYVQVYDSNDVFQWDRVAWPPEASDIEGFTQLNSTVNLIPNGQFKLHNNLPNSGLIQSSITSVAPPNWTFERPSTSTSVDNVLFTRINGFVSDPTSSPRYEIFIQTNGGSSSDPYKDLRARFDDVNKFSSDTQKYTVFFNARTPSSGNFTLNLNLIKNYGTGGDAQEVINIASFNVTSVDQSFSASFVWGDNSGALIGPDDDDFCQLAFSLPTGTALDIAMTDFVYLIGDINVQQFPITTDDDFIVRSLVPPVPSYDGNTLALPLIVTASGLDYDYSQIGKIYSTSIPTPGFGELLCDGSTYRTANFSPDGIPYSRLQKALSSYAPSSNTNGIPMYGTGPSYVTASRSGNVNQAILLSNNRAAVTTSAADGAVPTGFTFSNVCSGVASPYLQSWTTQGGVSYWFKQIATTTALIGDTTSSSGSGQAFSANTAPVSAGGYAYLDTSLGEVYGNAYTKQIVKGKSISVPAASSYLDIGIDNILANNIVIWFTLDGIGSAPLFPGVFVRVNLFSSMTVKDVAYCISRAACGAAVSYILPSSGSSTPPNSYFIFYSNSQQYYVWYNLNGTGIDPMIPGSIGIPVIYNNADSVSTMSLSTAIAINSVYFAVPDLRGQVIKGWDPAGNIDANYNNRYVSEGNRIDSIGFQSYIGSYQNHSNLSHGHPGTSINAVTTGGVTPFVTPTLSDPPNLIRDIAFDGSPQNDVNNIYLNHVIKY